MKPRSPSEIGLGVMGAMSVWHWVIVLVLVMLLFGRGRISGLMADLAGGIKSFRKNLSDDDLAEPARIPHDGTTPVAATAERAEPRREPT